MNCLVLMVTSGVQLETVTAYLKLVIAFGGLRKKCPQIRPKPSKGFRDDKNVSDEMSSKHPT